MSFVPGCSWLWRSTSSTAKLSKRSVSSGSVRFRVETRAGKSRSWFVCDCSLMAMRPDSTRTRRAEADLLIQYWQGLPVRPRQPHRRGMDNRGEIRDLLASRRAKITPAQAGLPVYGTHGRVVGLRREEVAMLAGVSVDYYTRLRRARCRSAMSRTD